MSKKDHYQAMQEVAQNKHRFALEPECPMYSLTGSRTLNGVEEGKPYRMVACDHLAPLFGGPGHGYWPSGEPLSANLVAFAEVMTRYLIEEPGDFDVVAGFCEHPALPERICVCRTWGRCTDA